ncbi:helix-turn-helix transcriptional regulator [Paenibacillus sp. TAB 01]|uniref:helix-turn-helix transcriptional regulator n=1 Tax=Paenibacillus sp. TAB 01 TaxID=3368988 RepID=UPI003753CA11
MKLERLISMIYMLLNNEVLSASALAEKYNVSQRTIYRDIDAICAAGIPVVSYQGVNGGYGIMEQYKMDKSLLGSYDVESLITILHSMSTVFDDDRARDTIHKLQTIQPDNQTQSLTMDIGSQRMYNDSLRLIRAAILNRQVIRFEYINLKNERMDRSVEPLRLIYKYTAWYLKGYCRARKEEREFRISRIVRLQSTQEIFQPRAEQERAEYWDDKMPEPGTDVVLHVNGHALARALDHFYDAEKQFHDDGTLTLTLKVRDPAASEWLTAVLLSFGEHLKIIEPAELRNTFRSKLAGMLNIYSEPDEKV